MAARNDSTSSDSTSSTRSATDRPPARTHRRTEEGARRPRRLQRRRLDDAADVLATNGSRAFGGGRQQHPEPIGVRPQGLVEVPGRELAHHGQQIGERVHVLDGSTDGRGHIAVQRIGIDQRAGGVAAREGRSQMGGDERGAGPPASGVDGDDPTPSARRHRAHRGRGGPFGQGFAVARPHVEPSGPDTDRRPERGHRLARLERQDGRTADRRRIDEPWLGDDDVGVELADRFDQLAVVGGGGDHSSASASIEEVHDLLGDVVRFEREHHPGHVVHSSVPS